MRWKKDTIKDIKDIEAEKNSKTNYTLLPCGAVSERPPHPLLEPPHELTIEEIVAYVFRGIGASSLNERARCFYIAMVSTLACAGQEFAKYDNVLNNVAGLEHAAQVMAYGAKKHGRGTTGLGTYRDEGSSQGRITTHLESWVRHLMELINFDRLHPRNHYTDYKDPESGFPVIGHAACQALITYDLFHNPNTVDTPFDVFLLSSTAKTKQD
jgi:hypothetical protein